MITNQKSYVSIVIDLCLFYLFETPHFYLLQLVLFYKT